MNNKEQQFAHLCITEELLRPIDLWYVRWMTEDDHKAFGEPFQKGGEPGWNIQEFRQLQEQGYSYCGIFLGGRLCSTAGLWKRQPDVWEVIAVGTKEDFRHCEMAKSVVHFIAGHILQYVKVASYTSRIDNIASIHTAQSVGFRFCANVVDGDKWCAKDDRIPVRDSNCPLLTNCKICTV